MRLRAGMQRRSFEWWLRGSFGGQKPVAAGRLTSHARHAGEIIKGCTLAPRACGSSRPIAHRPEQTPLASCSPFGRPLVSARRDMTSAETRRHLTLRGTPWPCADCRGGCSLIYCSIRSGPLLHAAYRRPVHCLPFASSTTSAGWPRWTGIIVHASGCRRCLCLFMQPRPPVWPAIGRGRPGAVGS